MRLDAARRSACAKKVREAWFELSGWGPPEPGAPPRVRMGRRPVRPAIGALSEFAAEESTVEITEARARLTGLVGAWPGRSQRLAIEGGTGLGKTTEAVGCCVRHATGRAESSGTLLFVAHDRKRVGEIVAMVRSKIAEAGGDPATVSDLLGRQPVDAELGQGWDTTRFACMNPVERGRAGRRGRRVKAEVCDPCPFSEECRRFGYLGHTEEALHARVLVTTLARLLTLSDNIWGEIGAVICDEDVLPGLIQDLWIVESDLERAARHILRRTEREAARQASGGRSVSARTHSLAVALPLLTGMLEALKGFEGDEPTAIVDLLPEDCEGYATEEGLRELLRAMPVRHWKTRGGERRRAYDALAPAEWERRLKHWTPRQVWGPLLQALAGDLRTGDSKRAATVRVERIPRRKTPPRIHVVRFNERTIRKLRARPLLLLDATLHPAIAPILDVKREVVSYRQGRSVVQVVASLHEQGSLREQVTGGFRLSARGCRVVAQIAAWFGGRRGYVFCRKPLADLLKAEAGRYYELRRAEFVTPRKERGWDAHPAADVFVVLGRYARNGNACLREAHALRSVYLRLTGSTQGLDDLERAYRAQPFMGRNKPLLYCGEPLERKTIEPADRLAALIQDADRVATVRQFIGRDRQSKAYVLLLRGDPTIPADALIEVQDLAEALPADRRPPAHAGAGPAAPWGSSADRRRST